MRVRDELRFATRSGFFVGWTAAALAGFEATAALAPAAERIDVLYRWMRRWSGVLLRAGGIELLRLGELSRCDGSYPARDARGRGRIFVMNHRSLVDIFVALGSVCASPLSRHDIGAWPLIGLAARRAGTVFVDRSSKESGSAAVDAMVRAVSAGQGVLVFPEGTTFAGDEVRPFRYGAFRAAERAQAEVVPLGVAYGDGSPAYVNETFLAHAHRAFASSRHRVALTAGAPIPPGPQAAELCRIASERVQALVHESRAALSGDEATPAAAPGSPEKTRVC